MACKQGPVDRMSQANPPTVSPTVSVATEGAATLAAQSDRYALYERAVQCPEAEVDFIDETFRALRGRPPRSLIEDFCGTAAVCCEWVQRHESNRALGLDHDPAVLAWAEQRRRAQLPADARGRVQLVEGDVMDAARATATNADAAGFDLVLAMNFSWWLIPERAALVRYFQGVRERLVADGLFVLDSYGGYDAFRVITEERKIDDDNEPPFTYVWDQLDYDPISGMMDCAIHFAFPDGSRLERAFSYRWRLWTLPELREVLAEAGFRNLRIYWQGWDEHGEADGVFKPVERAAPDAGWICYLTAEP